jgi:hypothetical protein
MVTATVQRLLPEIDRRIRLEAAQAAVEARGVRVH